MFAELVTLFAVIVMVIVLYYLFKAAKYLIVNSILGLIILFAANTLFGLKIAYSWLNILICAIGGVIGAVIVILLNLFGGMF
ncbi:MAG: pro-sigmaK processing inhibitor BofA family protein [Euryarchaeota archaeon]|nr:pro-sigmaK processing inhibitor BofA family protein [Euryarchaeota archaeon]